jgi:cysteine synthase
MLLRGQEEGKINQETQRIVEYSSGNTVISLAILSRVLGLAPVTAYISNKTSDAKLKLLRFFVSIQYHRANKTLTRLHRVLKCTHLEIPA